MFEIQHYASFVVGILIFQAVPGAGTLTILNATARNGLGAGFGAVIGTIIGDFIFMLAAVAGLAAFMTTHPDLFIALQWFGAGYLVWLGMQLLRTPVTHGDAAREPRQPAWVYGRQACLVSLTNPKVILFFVAFFPLFMRPGASGTTLFAMMAHVSIISLVYQGCIVLIGHAVSRRLSAIPSARKIATRIAGLALVGLGIKLAVGNR